MAQNHSHSSRRQAVTTSESVSQERYTRLKRKVQEIKTENERVNAELERARKRIKTLKRQKELLLDRISQYEDTDSSESEKSLNVSSMESSDSEELSSAANSRASSVPSVRNSKKGGRSRPAGKKIATSAPANNIVNTVPITHTPAAKPAPVKRASKRPLNTKTMKVQHVEKDENGFYILPVQIGILTVLNLGVVVYDRETFHNERYIWPVGYAVKRAYNSMINPELQTMYTCKIEDGGDGPKFVIEAEDQLDKPIVANTATGAWTTVVREANAIRRRDHSNSASGPDYFGFSQATIRKMIQDLPNASKCKNYTMQSFEVMKTRNNGGRRRANGTKPNGKNVANGVTSGPTAPVQTPIQESGERSSSNGSANGDVVISDAVEGESDEE